MGAVDATNVGEVAPTGANGQPVGGEAPEPSAPDATSGEGGGLPSANEGAEVSPWERARAEGYLPDDFKEDPYELAKSYANAQKYVEETNKEKARMGTEAKKQEQAQATQAEIMSMVPDFVANGMNLTEEMIAKATELGIDERDLKLGAFEYKENAQKAFSVVGGEEEYGAMMTFMDSHMSEEQKKAFNNDFGSAASEYAIKGLHAEYKSLAGGDGKAPKPRLEGKVKGQDAGAKPYSSQGEMLKDLNYLKTKGRTDKAARQLYETRKSITPDEILFGKKR